MQTQTIPKEVYETYIQQRTFLEMLPVSETEFSNMLFKGYEQYKSGEISLGEAAQQLGIGKGQLIDLLDLLRWQVAIY